MPDILNATTARKNLFHLIDQVDATHEPVIIAGPRANAVLISEEDFRAIEETMFLCSIPGMRSSLIRAAEEPIEAGTALEDVKW